MEEKRKDERPPADDHGGSNCSGSISTAIPVTVHTQSNNVTLLKQQTQPVNVLYVSIWECLLIYVACTHIYIINSVKYYSPGHAIISSKPLAH